MQKLKKHWVFVTLLIIGLIVRLIFMSEQGMSNDELSAWYRTRFTDWDIFWTQGVKVGDMHPAFYQVLLWFWVRIFGDSEWAMRSTSLLFYIFNSYLIYRIGAKYFSQLGALLVQGLYVGLTFTLLNTVFARPYNSGTFFLLIAFWAVLELKLNELKKWRWTLILALGLFGAMTSHYFAFLVALVLCFCSLFYIGKNNLKYLIVGGLIAVICFLPHLPITLFQVGRGGLGWLDAPKLSWPIDFIYLFFNESWLLFTILVIAFLTSIFYFGFKKWNGVSIFSISIFLITFIGAFILSHSFTPILREVVMLFILPFVFLPLFSSINSVSKKWEFILIAFITFLPLTDSLLRNQLFKPVHYGVFKEIGEQINNADKKLGRNNITYASNYNNVDYINFYLNKPLTETIIDWEYQESLYALRNRAKNAKTPFFCYSFSNKYHTPMFLEVIRKYYPGYEQSFLTKYSSYYLFNNKSARSLNKPFLIGHVKNSNFTSDEFFNDMKLDADKLPTLNSENSYFLVKSKGQIEDSIPFYIVILLERNGEMLKKKDGTPAFYVAYDQGELNDIGIEQEFFQTFTLPEFTLPTDKLSIYCWNPSKGKVRISDLQFYVISEKQ